MSGCHLSICVPLVSVPHISQSHQPSANFSVLTVIVVQICHADRTEASYSSTHSQRIFVIDKHLVNIHHIISKAYARYASDLWSLIMCICHFQNDMQHF